MEKSKIRPHVNRNPENLILKLGTRDYVEDVTY